MNEPAISATLQRFRNAAQDEKNAAEAELTNLVRSYINDGRHKFAFGGVVNLLTTIGTILEEKSQVEGDDWNKAANFVNDCADDCDLPYVEEV